jgi:hypothetical protein
VFDVESVTPDDRSAPIFCAVIPGRRATAARSDQTLFSRALIACLNGTAAERISGDGGSIRWQVSVNSLKDALEREVAALNHQLGAQQEVNVEGRLRGNPVIASFAGPLAGAAEVSQGPPRALQESTNASKDRR